MHKTSESHHKVNTLDQCIISPVELKGFYYELSLNFTMGLTQK